MAIINPDLQMIDGGGTAVTAPTTVAPTITGSNMNPTMTPYSQLTPAERAAMTYDEKLAYLAAERAARMADQALTRAASDPMLDFANRPDAPQSDPNYITYYSWVGGTTSGSWQLYRAPKTPENIMAYGSRAIGGPTQASSTGSAADANTLIAPASPVTDANGNVTFSSSTGSTLTLNSGVTTPNVVTPTTVTPVTGNTLVPPPVVPTTTTATPADTAARQSIIATLTDRFAQYGLASLATKIKELAIDGATEATITLGLQATPEYQQRFAANTARMKAGLSVLQPGQYLALEDSYRQVLRAYGLTAFDNDAYVQQFIANDMSPAELSNRVVTAVQRVQNADPAIAKQLRNFYGIGTTDMVAYVLDPQQQFQKIERQIAASEIGVAAGVQGLNVGVGVAEQLAAQGVTQAQAQKGYATIADILPTAEKLSAIYGGSTGTTYNQSTAEQEVFNSLASAQRARQKLTASEVAAFSAKSGAGQSALGSQTSGNI